MVEKDLALADVSLAEYFTSKYALWLDHRTHGKVLTVDQVEELSDSEVERPYARYSAR